LKYLLLHLLLYSIVFLVYLLLYSTVSETHSYVIYLLLIASNISFIALVVVRTRHSLLVVRQEHFAINRSFKAASVILL
jgi:hypothetical protein